MTVLSAVQSAAIRLSQVQPASLFDTTEPFVVEMADLATETAIAIAKEHDWQALTKLATLTGNGSALAFPLPVDFDRTILRAKLHSTLFRNAAFRQASNLDEWLFFNDSLVSSGFPGNWVLLGGQVQIYPPMAAAATARFYYITNQIVSDGKTAFTANSDTFLLPERLLTLGLIWRWLSAKRMEYAEHLRNYEIALAEAIGNDKGKRILTVGRRRWPADVGMAYPGTLGP